MTDAAAKARQLYDARQERTPIEPFTDADPSLTMADGYAVQKELVKLLLADGDEIIGYKVGLTAKPMQKLLGISQPDFGPVLQSTMYRNGDTVPVSRFLQPKIEGEIVFELGDRLEGPGVTTEQARAAISGARAGMEIIDSRIADWRIKLADTVSDLASNGGLVVSEELVAMDGIDPRLIGMALSRNGEVVESGAGAAALGDPVNVVAWLANVLGQNGVALEPGHLVLTGALHAAVPMVPGDEFLVEFDRLGSLRVSIGD